MNKKRINRIAAGVFTSFGIALGVFGLTLSCSADEPSTYKYSAADFGLGYNYSNSSKWYEDYSRSNSWYDNSWNDDYSSNWDNYEDWDADSDYSSDWNEDWNSDSNTDWYDYDESYDWSAEWDYDDNDEWSEDWNSEWSDDSAADEYVYDYEYDTDTDDCSDFYILPESDSRYYSEDELYGLSLDELTLARNEIYARHGRMFNRDEIREYFEGQPWYDGTVSPDSFSGSVLNEFEQANILLIASMESEYDDEVYENDAAIAPSDDALIDAETEVLTKKAFTDSIKNDQVEIMVVCDVIEFDDDAAYDECGAVYYDEYTGEECYIFEDAPEDMAEEKIKDVESDKNGENDETAAVGEYKEYETETDVSVEYFDDDEFYYDADTDSYKPMIEYSEYETEEVIESENTTESEEINEDDASENVEDDAENETECAEYDTEAETEYTEYNAEAETEYAEYNAEAEIEYAEYYIEAEAEYSEYDTEVETEYAEYNAEAETEYTEYNTEAEIEYAEYYIEAEAEYSEYDTEVETECTEYNTEAETEYSEYNTEAETEYSEYDTEAETEYSEYDTEAETEYAEYNAEDASESEYIEENTEDEEDNVTENASETEYAEGNAEYVADSISESEDTAEAENYNTEDADMPEDTAEYEEENWSETEDTAEYDDYEAENENADNNTNDYCFFMPIEESCYFDLDGDGAEDTITVNGYYSERSDGSTMINGFRLTINDQGCDLSGINGMGSYCILNINETDGTLQVGLQYYIDDDYVKTSIYSYAYDGIHLLGEISGVFDSSVYNGIYPLATCSGDGILGSYRKLDLFQTWFAPTEWILRNGELAELVPSAYEPLDLFNGQGIDLKLMQGITVKCDNIDSEDVIGLPAGTDVHLTGTDNETWISMTAVGYESTLYLEVYDYDKVYVTDTGFLTSASLVFENMSKFA